jgi:hypothetical protein
MAGGLALSLHSYPSSPIRGFQEACGDGEHFPLPRLLQPSREFGSWSLGFAPRALHFPDRGGGLGS